MTSFSDNQSKTQYDNWGMAVVLDTQLKLPVLMLLYIIIIN